MQDNQLQTIERGFNTNQPAIHYSNQTSNQPIEQMQTEQILQVPTLKYNQPVVQTQPIEQMQTSTHTNI